MEHRRFFFLLCVSGILLLFVFVWCGRFFFLMCSDVVTLSLSDTLGCQKGGGYVECRSLRERPLGMDNDLPAHLCGLGGGEGLGEVRT